MLLDMSSRKPVAAESSLPVLMTSATPSRFTYAPSTPHALRALQQRSSAKRSVRSARKSGNIGRDTLRPDGSARNILRQFARLTAPLTRKRVSTPAQRATSDADKENHDDSLDLSKPGLTFNIDESVDEGDSELLVVPTPTVLPDEDDSADGDDPTVTFQNVMRRAESEKIDRRRSALFSESDNGTTDDEEANEQEGDLTILTERGRRALSEEATGRLSRYSFGSLRMSDFGTELEIRRESDRVQREKELGADDYAALDGGDTVEIGADTENLNYPDVSLTEGVADESIQIPGLADGTFVLPMPNTVEEEEGQFINLEERSLAASGHPRIMPPGFDSLTHADGGTMGTADKDDNESAEIANSSISRRQTLLESATAMTHRTRRKRLRPTRHGTMVPLLPSSLIKRVVYQSYEKQQKRKPKLGRDHMTALEQASEWFFEQLGEDLATYSSHGRRKRRIDADDVVLLMKRQRSCADDDAIRELAEQWLPPKVLDELDI